LRPPRERPRGGGGRNRNRGQRSISPHNLFFWKSVFLGETYINQQGLRQNDENQMNIKKNYRPRPHLCTPFGGSEAHTIAQWSGCGSDSVSNEIFARPLNWWIRLGLFQRKRKMQT